MISLELKLMSETEMTSGCGSQPEVKQQPSLRHSYTHPNVSATPNSNAAATPTLTQQLHPPQHGSPDHILIKRGYRKETVSNLPSKIHTVISSPWEHQCKELLVNYYLATKRWANKTLAWRLMHLPRNHTGFFWNSPATCPGKSGSMTATH